MSEGMGIKNYGTIISEKAIKFITINQINDFSVKGTVIFGVI